MAEKIEFLNAVKNSKFWKSILNDSLSDVSNSKILLNEQFRVLASL